MALAYSEFTSTPATVAADIVTKILLSTDWSRPNAAGYPGLVQATTTSGTTMNVDIGVAALTSTNDRIPLRAWRTNNGTTGADSKDFGIWWRLNGGGASTDPLHVVVSASKDMLWISIEGPQAGEANAENVTTGSVKTYFFMSALNPYFAGDTNPVVVAGGKVYAASNLVSVDNEPYGAVFVSQGGTVGHVAWAPATLATVQPLRGTDRQPSTPQPVAVLDSNNYYMFPLVVIEREAGPRGTLIDLYYAGVNDMCDTVNPFDVPAPVGESITYSGKTYRLVAVVKGNTQFSGSGWYLRHPLGGYNHTNINDWFRSTVIGIRTA